MDFVIYPHKGVNDIEFGMTPEQVRQRMGDAELTTARGDVVPESGYVWPFDMYFHEGARFDYDDEGFLESAEFWKPARALLGGVNVVDLTVGEGTMLLSRYDPALVKRIDGATSFDLALSIWVENFRDGDEARIDTFLTGRPGLYDAERPGADKPAGN